MASTSGQQDAALKRSLLANAERFAFFQAVRLLQRGGADVDRAPWLRIRPRLSLAFPDTDIDGIGELPGGGYEIEANFFGLYGVASPLPTFYTEDLFDEEREGRHATRDFIDIVNQSLYALLVGSWTKYRLPLRVVERADARLLDHLYAFVGLQDGGLRSRLPGGDQLLRYSGLFNLQTRSALGLTTLLADAFAPARVEVVACVPRVVAIPAEQRLRLGECANRLGDESYLGSEVDDCENGLVVRLADLPAELFHALLPGSEANRRLQFMIAFYLTDPLDVAVELMPRVAEVHAARLGEGDWSRLGLDSWLAPRVQSPLAPVRFDVKTH